MKGTVRSIVKRSKLEEHLMQPEILFETQEAVEYLCPHAQLHRAMEVMEEKELMSRIRCPTQLPNRRLSAVFLQDDFTSLRRTESALSINETNVTNTIGEMFERAKDPTRRGSILMGSTGRSDDKTSAQISPILLGLPIGLPLTMEDLDPSDEEKAETSI